MRKDFDEIPPLVIVFFRDHEGDQDGTWFPIDEVKTPNIGLCAISGFLLHEDDDSLVLSQLYSESDPNINTHNPRKVANAFTIIKSTIIFRMDVSEYTQKRQEK